jgi:hypothetical protein
MSLYDDVEREARHDWLDERERAYRWVDGELDDLAPEERAALAREAEAEWLAEEEANEQADRDRAERGTRDQDRRSW